MASRSDCRWRFDLAAESLGLAAAYRSRRLLSPPRFRPEMPTKMSSTATPAVAAIRMVRGFMCASVPS
jgi:hypothetical protein